MDDPEIKLAVFVAGLFVCLAAALSVFLTPERRGGGYD
jgi:hypothetical protein